MATCVDVCGTGGWTGPLPGDPNNNSILTATPAFGGIDVSWVYPTINPFAVAHTLLYRGVSPDFINAIERQVVAGNFFYDKLDTGTTYYYWIKIVSVNGTIGELIGPASATARPLIEDLIEQLTGHIDNGVLATSLKATLDNISMVNANLNAEIFDRETGETSFASALADVAAGVAEAHTFITTEITSRVTAEAAIAEQINLVAVTLGGDIAAVAISADAWIGPHTTLDGKVSNIGALYTAKLTVNGLVGGFGVYNDGTTVEAGFDVDTFWVGRTAANKRKPFIIVGSETFIDQAVINKLTFSKLTDEAGTFIVADGKIQATYLNINGIDVRKADGTLVLSAGDTLQNQIDPYESGATANQSDATTNAAISAAASAAADATAAVTNKLDKASTSILGINASDTVRMSGVRIGDLVWDGSGVRTSGKGIALTPQGMLGHNGTKVTFAVDAVTGDATFGGVLTADAINAVNTINIAGETILANRFAAASDAPTLSSETDILTASAVNPDTGSCVIAFSSAFSALYTPGGDGVPGFFSPMTFRLKRNGSTVATFVAGSATVGEGVISYSIQDTPGAISTVYTLTATAGVVSYRTLLVMGCKR